MSYRRGDLEGGGEIRRVVSKSFARMRGGVIQKGERKGSMWEGFKFIQNLMDKSVLINENKESDKNPRVHQCDNLHNGGS